MSLPLAVRVAVISVALGAGACESGGPDMFTPAPRPSVDFSNIGYATWTNAEPPYRLYPGDEVDLAVASAPELNKTLTVRAAPLKVFVGGEVDKPGVYDMPGDINALQAVIMAGSFKTSARRSQVVIIRRGPDGRAMLRTVDLRAGSGNPAGDL